MHVSLHVLCINPQGQRIRAEEDNSHMGNWEFCLWVFKTYSWFHADDANLSLNKWLGRKGLEGDWIKSYFELILPLWEMFL